MSPRLYLTLPFFLAALATTQAKPLIGGPKDIAIAADGTIPGTVVAPQMGMGSYIKGASKVVVPLISVAFESSAKAFNSNRSGNTITSKSLETHLLIDEKVLQSITDELQAIIEKDLADAGFEVLPKDSVDQDTRVAGITKDGKIGVEIGDNFMAGFNGNGVYNRWYTSGNRPLFGTGATGALSHTSPLIRTARDVGKTLLFYRFKVQYTEIDAKKGIMFSYVKGQNILHILGADVAVFTPANTNGGMIKLKENITAGSDYIQEIRDLPKDQSDKVGQQMGAVLDSLLNGTTTTTTSGKPTGHYAIIANPERYKTDTLALIKALSKQFAEALRKAQAK